jgi:hypothetical protein
MAVRGIPVRLRLVKDEDQAAKGRRLYEQRKTEEEGKAEAGERRWFLVRPLDKGSPCWLVFADKDGKFQDVLRLE